MQVEELDQPFILALILVVSMTLLSSLAWLPRRYMTSDLTIGITSSESDENSSVSFSTK